MLAKVEQVRETVAVLRPAYGAYGDSTELWTPEGIVIDRRSIRSVKRALARSYAVDLQAQAESISAIIERQNVLPFYPETHRVFVPFKMRSPVHPNDRSCGYVDVNWIDAVGSEQGLARLQLKDGRFLCLACTAATAAQTICIGQRLFANLNPVRAEEEDIVAQAAVLLIRRWQHLERILLKYVDQQGNIY